MTFPFRSQFNFPFELITEDGEKIETKRRSFKGDYKTNDKIAEERHITGQIGAAIDMIVWRAWKICRSDKEEKIHTETHTHTGTCRWHKLMCQKIWIYVIRFCLHILLFFTPPCSVLLTVATFAQHSSPCLGCGCVCVCTFVQSSCLCDWLIRSVSH